MARRSIEVALAGLTACWLSSGAASGAEPVDDRSAHGMLELAASGALARLGCQELCGELSLGWAGGARALYRLEGVLAIGGMVEHSRFSWTPEARRDSGTLGVTLAGALGRVYPLTRSVFDPYVELGLGLPFIDSSIDSRGDDGAFFLMFGAGIDVHLLSRLRVGPRASEAVLFGTGPTGGSAVADPNAPPYLPRLSGMQALALVVTYGLD